MRILTVGSMYPPHHQGGYELMWQAFVRHARSAGHDVRVLASDHREPGAAVTPEDEGVERLLPWWWRDHGFPRRPLSERLAIQRRAGRFLDERLRSPAPDVVMWWSMGGMPLHLLARARRAGLPAVGVVHDAWPAYGPQVDQHVPRVRLGPGDADAWSVNSEWLREGLLALPGWSRAAAVVHVQHPGIDPARVAPVAPGPWRWRLACVGRVEPRKGVHHALEALAQLPAEAQLAVVGAAEPGYVQELRVRARELGVAHRLHLEGTVRDVAGTYAAADAVLFPVTWDEPFGLVPVEAMAVGRPVVGTATGGARDVLADGDNALVVAPGDPAALAAAVRRLAADPALRERLRAGGTATAARFTQDRFAGGLLELVSEVVARRARAET